MKKIFIRLFVSLFIICSTLTTKAQLSIDIYSGYNHSKEEHRMPWQNNYSISYYTGNAIDTVVWTDTVFILWEQLPVFTDDGSSMHNFTLKYVYGINLQYAYSNYLKTGFSFEKHGFNKKENSFIKLGQSYLYSHESLHKDSLMSFTNADYNYNYNTFSSSLIQSIYFPYKKFTVFADFGLSFYYFLLNLESTLYTFSYYHYRYNARPSRDYGYSFRNKYEGHSFGVKTALGVSYEFFDNMSVFASVGITRASLKIRSGTYIEHIEPSEVIEMDDFPREIPADRMPDFGKINYNSINFRLGLRYTFGNKNDSQLTDQSKF
jgi:hypothetical protein